MKRNGAQRLAHYQATRRVRPIFRVTSTHVRPSIKDQRIARVLETLANHQFAATEQEAAKLLENTLLYGTSHPEIHFQNRFFYAHPKDANIEFSEMNNLFNFSTKSLDMDDA